MNHKHRIIAVLLRSYPAEWRREYGAELADLLATQALGVGVVVDVLWSGFQQRMRSLEPAMPLAFTAMLGSFGLVVANVLAPQPYGGWTTVLEPSSMTFPTVRVSAGTVSITACRSGYSRSSSPVATRHGLGKAACYRWLVTSSRRLVYQASSEGRGGVDSRS